jgi:hypothetical protein
MPWYYSGPEAKPVGPVSLEELHAQRLSGVISPETYVIESGGASNAPMEWKRYQEVFPPSPSLPAVLSSSPPPVPVNPPPVAQRHPLFPSAGAAVPHPAQGPFSSHTPPPVPAVAPAVKANAWCSWGFGLSLAGFVLLFVTCGFVGWLLALPGLILSFAGLMQVHRHREQSGQGLAIFGLLLSSFVLLTTLILLAVAVPYFIRHHDQTATEESTNDSE